MMAGLSPYAEWYTTTSGCSRSLDDGFEEGYVALFERPSLYPLSVMLFIALQVHDADLSSKPGCSPDQKQTCCHDDDPDGAGNALTGRCETFDGDDCRHDSHREKVHDADDQEDRHQTSTTVAAVESKAQAMSPGSARVRRQCATTPGRLSAASKVTRLPRGELERTGDQ